MTLARRLLAISNPPTPLSILLTDGKYAPIPIVASVPCSPEPKSSSFAHVYASWPDSPWLSRLVQLTCRASYQVSESAEFWLTIPYLVLDLAGKTEVVGHWSANVGGPVRLSIG